MRKNKNLDITDEDIATLLSTILVAVLVSKLKEYFEKNEDRIISKMCEENEKELFEDD